MIRGFNQLRARNVNAPDASGLRPEPTVGTVTQIESTGRSHIDQAFAAKGLKMDIVLTAIDADVIKTYAA